MPEPTGEQVKRVTVDEAREAAYQNLVAVAFGGTIPIPAFKALVRVTEAVSAAVREDERERRRLVLECHDCSFRREADSGQWAEELRMKHESARDGHNVWISRPAEEQP